MQNLTQQIANERFNLVFNDNSKQFERKKRKAQILQQFNFAHSL